MSLLAGAYALLHVSIALSIPSFEPATHNDDWVYVHPVEQLWLGNGLRLHPITAALALPQVIAGWGLCELRGGLSYSLLRNGMVVFGIVPVWLMWGLMRRLGFSASHATSGGLLLLVNPVMVSMTWSFQTDVPFLGFLLLGLWSLLVAEDPAQRRWASPLAVASLLLASLTRQTGLFITLAAVVYLVQRRRWGTAAAVGLTIPLTMLAERYFIAQSSLVYLLYAQSTLATGLKSFTVGRAFLCLYEGAHFAAFLGLFVLPIIVMHPQVMAHRKWLAACAMLMLAVFFLDRATGLSMFPGNYINVGEHVNGYFSLGPVTISQEDVTAALAMPRASAPLREVAVQLIKLTALIGGTFMLARLILATREAIQGMWRRLERPWLLVELTVLLSLLSVLTISVFIGRKPFDKYLIITVPVIIALSFPQEISPRKLRWLVLPFALILAVVSYVGVVDYWHWNAARWEAIAKLEAQGIDSPRIDGGYEYNAIHDTLFVPPEIINFLRERGKLPERWGRSRTPSEGEMYMVEAEPRRSTDEIVFRIPYTTPLDSNPRYVIVSKKTLTRGK